MNKKGQDLPIGTLILIVLGVVVLIIIIVGFTTGWDFIFGKIPDLPGQDLQVLATSCKFSAENNLVIDYCSFKEVDADGDEQYVNCQDSRIQAALSGTDVSDMGNCENFDSELEYCQKNDLDEDVLVNGKVCGSSGWGFVGPTAS